jgi:hypothetical protein
MRFNVVPVLTTVLRLGLGFMLLYSGLIKARHPYQFLSNVYDYELVGPELGKLVAVGLPVLEIVIGGCLVGGVCVGGALTGSMLLGAVFVFATALAVYRGLNIACGCFGSSGAEVVTTSTIARAAGVCLASFLALLGTIWGSGQQRPQTDKEPAGVMRQPGNVVEAAD